MRKWLLTFFVIFMSGLPAWGYIFDQAREGGGSYLRGTVGPWSQGQTPWSESSGTGVSWSNQYSVLPSGEFGFLYNTGRVTWRLGVEGIFSSPMNNVNGSGTNNQTNYYQVTNNFSVINAKLGAEFVLKKWQQSKIWLLLEGGPDLLSMTNSYSFSAAGSTNFGGLGNFTEQLKGQSIMYAGGFGFETLMSDTTTIAFELGYREESFSSINYASNVTNFQGAQTSGSAANQNSGSARTIDFSGFYAAIDFRIWFF